MAWYGIHAHNGGALIMHSPAYATATLYTPVHAALRNIVRMHADVNVDER